MEPWLNEEMGISMTMEAQRPKDVPGKRSSLCEAFQKCSCFVCGAGAVCGDMIGCEYFYVFYFLCISGICCFWGYLVRAELAIWFGSNVAWWSAGFRFRYTL